MVEAIKQMYRNHPTKHILICAPSNAAADVLLTRLATTLTPKELFRFNSYQRDIHTIESKIKEYSHYQKDAFTFPSMETFLSYKCVVCTCIMAGKLFNYGVQKGKQ